MSNLGVSKSKGKGDKHLIYLIGGTGAVIVLLLIVLFLIIISLYAPKFLILVFLLGVVIVSGVVMFVFYKKAYKPSTNVVKKESITFAKQESTEIRHPKAKSCPYCKATIGLNDVVCGNCNQKQESREIKYPRPSSCPYCKSKIGVNDMVCGSCGQRVVYANPHASSGNGWWVTFIVVFIFCFGVYGCISCGDNTVKTTTTTKTTLSKAVQIVSSDFPLEDFCDFTSFSGGGINTYGKTDLQREDIFDRKYKNKYVEWDGTVGSISKGMFGGYTLQVKHCPNTLVSDVLVNLKDNQKQNALELQQGEMVTYRAKLTRWGSLLGFSADEGEII